MAMSARGAFSTNSFNKNSVGIRPTTPAPSTNTIISPNATMPGEPCAASSVMLSSLRATAAKPATTAKT